MYVSINSGADWTKWSNGFPTVSTMDMVIQATEADFATIKVFDMEGELMRSLQVVLEKGINRTYWNFDRKGVESKFGQKRQRGSREGEHGGGGYVLAGDYTVRLVYKGDSSQVQLTVKPDPRMDYDIEALKEKQVFVDGVMENIRDMNAESVKIKSCRKTLETIQKLTKDQGSDSLKTTIKAMDKTLKAIEKELFGGGEEVQGIFQDKNSFKTKVSPLLYLSYSRAPITPNQMVALEDALAELNKMEDRIKDFFDEDWVEFQLLVESQELSLFGEK